MGVENGALRPNLGILEMLFYVNYYVFKLNLS